MFSVVLDPNEHFKVVSYKVWFLCCCNMKLTGYLDLVEVCLNEQISIQSDSLFSAIKQLQEFQVHVYETLRTIHSLEYFAYLKCSVDLRCMTFSQITQFPLFWSLFINVVSKIWRKFSNSSFFASLLISRQSKSLRFVVHSIRPEVLWIKIDLKSRILAYKSVSPIYGEILADWKHWVVLWQFLMIRKTYYVRS